MSRFLLEGGNVLIDAPEPLRKFLKARRDGASKSEMMRLKLAAQLNPARAERIAQTTPKGQS
jgi:hypothetical protein